MLIELPEKLSVAQDTGMIAGAIRDYLEQPKKVVNPLVLAEMKQAFHRVVMRQLMQEREDRKGYESTTLYSGPCARKARLTFDGVEREPLKARTLLKFLLGDIVELAVLGIAKLSGKNIGANNVDLTIMGLDGNAVQVHPDGLLSEPDEDFNVEIKSCDSKTFDRWIEKGGPNDDWGYLTQTSIEVQAWREHGHKVNRTVFVAVSTGSRQGSIAEWIIDYDQSKVDAWHDRRQQRMAKDIPSVPFNSEPETEFLRGSKLSDEQQSRFSHATFDKNGKRYGTVLFTGREVLPVSCSYCDFKRTGKCWPGVEEEIKDGKPVFVVPKKG